MTKEETNGSVNSKQRDLDRREAIKRTAAKYDGLTIGQKITLLGQIINDVRDERNQIAHTLETIDGVLAVTTRSIKSSKRILKRRTKN
jgi:hypothetical protein